MKKFISLALALVMALSLATVAWGATTVTDIAGLTSAVAAGGDIVLGADMEISTSLRVSTNVNLDLNGHTLVGPHNYVGGTNLYAFIVESGTLTLTDTSAAQTGEIACKYSGIETKGGTFVMNGGKITAGDMSMAAAIVNYGGSVIINDGVVNAYDTAVSTMAYFAATATTEINGGEVSLLSSANNYAVFETGGAYNTGSASVEINGGDVNSNGAAFAAYDTTTGTAAMEIAGGTFDTDVSAYLAPGTVLENGVVKTDISGAKTSYNGLYLKGTNQGAVISANPISLGYYKANAAKYDKVDGHVTAKGNVAYFLADDLAYSGVYVQVSTLAQADVVAYADAAGKIVKFYLDDISDATYFEGVAFNNFGEKCGQVDMDPVVGVTYYTVKGDLTKAVYASAETGSNLMVGGKLVTVNPAPVATAYVGHTVVSEMEDGKLVKVYCSACGLQAVEAPNYMSIPKGADQTGLTDNWYWAGITAGTSTDKVQSAQTFDAGIAMYVGMSVMAACGSAVVLKKKD